MISKIDIGNLLKEVLTLLIKKEYKKLKDKGFLGDLKIEDILKVIENYPGKLTIPTDKELLSFHEYSYGDNEVYVEFDIYFDQRKSDLTLCVEIVKYGDDLTMKIQDLRVL